MPLVNVGDPGLNKEYTETVAGVRNTKIVTQFGRDNSDDQMNPKLSRDGTEMKGGTGNIDMSIKNGKVPEE